MSARWNWALAMALGVLIVVPLWTLKRARAASSSAPEVVPATLETGVSEEAPRTVPAALPVRRTPPSSEALLPARTARDRIEAAERLMVEEDKALTAALEKMEAGKFVPAEQQRTVGAFRVYVQGLRTVANDLLTRHREFVASQKKYRESLAAAPARFREASKLFKDYAAEEPFAEIRRDYEQLARDWLTLSTLVERQAADVGRESLSRDFADTIRFVERTALFLGRLDAHLESFPVHLDSREIAERHIADLKRYVDAFEALRNHLESYREKLRDGAVSPEVRERLLPEARRKVKVPTMTASRTSAAPSTAPVSPVAASPPLAARAPVTAPEPVEETYPCCYGLSHATGSFILLYTDRTFRAGERFTLRKDGHYYDEITVTTVTVGRDRLVSLVVETTRCLPTGECSVVLTRKVVPQASDPARLAANR